MIPNAIDAETFQRRTEKGEAKRRFGIAEDRVVVGAVGRLSAEKGFDLLIRAVDRLISEGLSLELVIAGEGPAREELEKVVASAANRDRLRLLGHCPDVMPFYESMDIFALSSLREGLPNALLEAMSMEVPTVATRIAGVPKVIEDGVSGFLIEAGNETALADAIRRLAVDAELREKLGTGGRRCMIERFSFHKRMELVREVYDRVLGQASALAAPSAMTTHADLTAR
jgi:glycosyltransferase involved in cell wall biosynthesis